MKKSILIFLFLSSVFLYGCKDTIETPKPDDNNQITGEFGVGFKTASASELANANLVPQLLMGTLPNSFFLNMPISGNQGGQGSCVSWAAGYSMGSLFMNKANSTNYGTNSNLCSPKYIYNQIKQGSDCGGGSTYPQNLDILRDKGVCTLTDMPYNDKECGLQPNSSQDNAASRNKILKWEVVDKNNITNIKTILYSGLPVMIAVYGDANFDNLQAPYILTSRSGAIRGGHAITVTGYDDSKSAFKVQNSWGSTWKDNGYLWISYSFFPNAVIGNECYVAYPTKSSPTDNLTQGLVLHIPCNGNAQDISGNNNHGTVNGATLVADRNGNSNSAYQFGGFNNPNFIKVNNSTSLKFSSTFTFATWVKINNKQGMDGFGANSNGVNSAVQHCLFAKDWDRDKAHALLNYTVSPTETHKGFYTGLHAGASSVFTNISYNETQWVHLVYVFTGNQLKLYKNGTLVISTTGSLDFTPSNTQDLYFGRFSNFWYPLDGVLDDMRMYNRALTDSEVQKLYQL